MEILNQLGINEGFFWMLGLYLATFFLAYFFGLKDLSVALVERNNRIIGRAEKAVHLKEELRKIQETLAVEMRRVRAESNEAFLSLRTKAQTEQKKILQEARDHAASEIKTVRNSVIEKTQVEMKKLEQEIPALAKLILDQIMSPATVKAASRSTELRG